MESQPDEDGDETTLSPQELQHLPKCQNSKGRCCPVIAFRHKWSEGAQFLIREARHRCICNNSVQQQHSAAISNSADLVEERNETFTTDRIRKVIFDNVETVSEEAPFWPDFCRIRDDKFRYVPRFYKPTELMHLVTTEQRRKGTAQMCHTMLEIIRRPDDHIQKLDDVFTTLIDITFVNPRDCVEIMVKRARSLLLRLSREALPYAEKSSAGLCTTLPNEYFVDDGTERTVQNLKVTTFVWTAILKIAVLVNIDLNLPGDPPVKWVGPSTQAFVNLLAELLEAALLERPSSTVSQGQLLILRCFLWTCWCRCLSIQRWYVLRAQVRAGHSSPAANLTLQLEGYQTVQSVLQQSMLTTDYTNNKLLPDYMCPWAFEVTRAESASFGAHFRTLISRFDEQFANRPPRCVFKDGDISVQCDGRSPGNCMRFTGAVIENQSVHSNSCNTSCQRLFWNEKSYRDATGGRAVCFDLSQDRRLNYKSASARTMAISHVWSHGQGGRPDEGPLATGFNQCLHDRYSKIAASHRCDSYWMDTPCIPDDHQLRKEAIENINDIFYHSKLTLVCDRDLMTIDVGSNELQVDVAETILSVLLVCDWNVRAWTLLEAVRGSRQLHLLCKDDKTVRLMHVIEIVHSQGSVELVNLFLTSFHLLPLRTFDKRYANMPRHRPNGQRIVSGNPEIQSHGVARTGNMLSHRHASRQGDEIVIWSLLNDMPVCYEPEQFWSHISQFRTGYIVSTIPRIQGVKGFSWAPSRPDFPIGQDGAISKRQYGEEGLTDNLATLYDEGLTAEWMICDLRDLDWRKSLSSFAWLMWTGAYMRRIWELPFMPSKPTGRTIYKFQNKAKLASYYWNMCWMPSTTYHKLLRIVTDLAKEDNIIGVVRPATRTSYNDDAVENRNDVDGTLLAVVGSSDDDIYLWRGVVEWESSIPLPPFFRKRLLLQ